MALTLTLSPGLLTQASAAHAFVNASQTAQRQRLNLVPATLSSFAPRGTTALSVRFARRLVKEKNNRLKYTIDARYPQLVGAKEPGAVQFNRAVKELLTGEIGEFKKNAGVPDASVPADIQWSTFDANYSIEYSSPDLISVAFNVSPYYAGAAHPMHYSMVLNYDLKTGRTLKLSDLFKPRSNHLQVISDYAIKALTKELGAEADSNWIATGAAPDSKNYKSWNITPKGLSITFDPYQVASYAEGEHIVVIPYAALRNVINMNGLLGGKVKRQK